MTACLGLWLILATSAFAGVEKPIDLEEVPEELLANAREALPTATFSSANTEEEDGVLVYEIQGKLKDGRRVEVDLFPGGKIEEIEVEFTVDLVPGAVLAAVERKLPGFVPVYVEASHSASKKVMRYELVGKIGDQEMDIEVSADGRRIEVSDS